ncbi:MAG: sensor domain-containing diguanylate cyclase [Pseudomonadota bacterium]
MTMRTRGLPLLALAIHLFLASTHASATTTVIEQDSAKKAIGNAEYLVDRDGSLSIEALRQGGDFDWQSSSDQVLSFGYTSHTYWVRFALKGKRENSERYLLEIAYPVLDHVDAYLFRDNELTHHYAMGDRRPYSDRPIDHPNLIFPVDIDSEVPTEIYLRVQSSSSVQIPLALYSDRAMLEHKYNEAFIQALFFGAMIIMVAYNFLVFLTIRDISYFYYVMSVISITLLVAGIQGLTFKYFFPEAIGMNDKLLVLSLSGMLFFPALFFRSFLSLSNTRPKLSRLLLVFAALGVITAIGGFIFPYRIMMVTTMGLVMTAILVGFYGGIVRWLDGYYAAKYFNIAWSFMLAGGFLLALNKLHILPRNLFTENVGQIGATMEVMLMSFALANSMNHERKLRERAQRESAMAQKELLEHQIRANEDLDRTVRQRTEELEKANALLKKISETDGLTGLLNRRAFESRFDTEYKRAFREKSSVAIVMIDLDHFKQINDQYGHPFGDLCLKTVAKVVRSNLRRPPDVAARYGGEEFILLLPGIDSRGAEVVANNILFALADTVIEDGETRVSMTASMGIASATPSPETSREQLLKEADEKLYQAKENGRNQVVL